MVIITIRPSDKYLFDVHKSVTYSLDNKCYEILHCRDKNGRKHIWLRIFYDEYIIPTVISENGMPLPYLLNGFQQGTSSTTIWEYIENIVNNPCQCCNN